MMLKQYHCYNYYNLKQLFSILIYFKMLIIPVMITPVFNVACHYINASIIHSFIHSFIHSHDLNKL